jgi:hypothetical protein
MVAQVIAQIQQSQKSMYNFPKNVQTIAYLTYGLHMLNEDAVWHLSKRCEFTSSLVEELQLATSPSRESGFSRFFKRKTVRKEDMAVTLNPIFGAADNLKRHREKIRKQRAKLLLSSVKKT